MRMQLHFTYTRPPKDDEERMEGYTDEDPVRVETLTCVDPESKDGQRYLRETFEEFMQHIGPNATFHVGGVCTSKHHTY